jgi:hypothetical protein
MVTKVKNIKISNGVRKGFELHQYKLRERKHALVGILASSRNNEVIDNTYFIRHREGGCKWMPHLRSGDISQTICTVIKEQKDIRGLVLILANDVSDGMNSWFNRAIWERGWANPNFVYIVCGRSRITGYRIRYNRNDDFSKVTITTVKEVN